MSVARIYRLNSVEAVEDAKLSGTHLRPSLNLTANAQPSEYGAYGDNVFCGMACGWLMAVRLTRAIGIPDVFRMLPPDHNPEIFARFERDKRRAKSRATYQRKKERRARAASKTTTLTPDPSGWRDLDQDQGP